VRIPHDLAVEPGTSRKNLTGGWRVNVPKFLHDKCTNCQICLLSCPDGAIVGEQKNYQADLDYCKGCGICAAVCPVSDIVMEIEEK
jgi:pyruvate ferredoxin oxidoreductase delta subunit